MVKNCSLLLLCATLSLLFSGCEDNFIPEDGIITVSIDCGDIMYGAYGMNGNVYSQDGSFPKGTEGLVQLQTTVLCYNSKTGKLVDKIVDFSLSNLLDKKLYNFTGLVKGNTYTVFSYACWGLMKESEPFWLMRNEDDFSDLTLFINKFEAYSDVILFNSAETICQNDTKISLNLKKAGKYSAIKIRNSNLVDSLYLNFGARWIISPSGNTDKEFFISQNLDHYVCDKNYQDTWFYHFLIPDREGKIGVDLTTFKSGVEKSFSNTLDISGIRHGFKATINVISGKVYSNPEEMENAL